MGWHDLSRRFGDLVDGYGRLVGPDLIAVAVPAEAVVALEAVATGLGRAGRRTLSIESSRYGSLVTTWLHSAGAQVTTLAVPAGEVVTPDRVIGELERDPGIEVVSLAQAEILTAVAQPVGEIIEAAHARGAAVVVDAVAAIAGLPAPTGADIVVLGPQKALDGPASLSFVVSTERGWRLLAPDERAQSVLSLPALRSHGRAVIAGDLPPVSAEADLDSAAEALDALHREGLAARLQRHDRVRAAVHAGLRAGGITPLVTDVAQASTLATTVLVPAGVDPGALAAWIGQAGAAWVHGGHSPRGDYLRVSHYGRRAVFDHALTQVVVLAQALRRVGRPADVGGGAAELTARWFGADGEPSSPIPGKAIVS